MPVIIDGYNLLRSIQKTSEDFEELSCLHLSAILSTYLQSTGDHGQIVFDGTGPPDKTGFDDFANLEVIFSGPKTDADTVIEEKIIANTAPKRLTVVSSDRRLKAAARKRKADSIKSDAFWQKVIKQMSKKKKTPTEPTQKREGLNESETQHWLKFFNLEQ